MPTKRKRFVRRVKRWEENAIAQDFRLVLGLRAWPIALMLTWFLQITTAPPPPGVPSASIVIDSCCWAAIVATGAAVVWPVRPVRWLHLFLGFMANLARSFYQVFGFANSSLGRQLLGASLWGGLALATLTIYLMTLPYVIEREDSPEVRPHA